MAKEGEFDDAAGGMCEVCARPSGDRAAGRGWEWTGELCKLQTRHFDVICLPHHNACGAFSTTREVDEYIDLKNVLTKKENGAVQPSDYQFLYSWIR